MASVSFSSTFASMKHNNSYAKPATSQKEQSYMELPYTKKVNYPPAVIGGLNAFCWFTVAAFADKCLNKIFKSKLNPKFMLPLEIAFGLLMGSKAYKVAKNNSQK